MKEQKNIPKLRFPEFKGEWEKKKLGEVAEINPSNKSLPEKFIYIDLESVSKGELLKENEIIKEEAPSRAQRVLKENDVLFQMVRPYQMNNLFFNKIGDYVASTGYAQIRTGQIPKYVFQYLHFQKFVDKVIERCTGTSYPAINSTDLSNIELSFPTLPEQKRIASFFTVLDQKIAELKQKKNLLEQYKKGVMQSIFNYDSFDLYDYDEKTNSKSQQSQKSNKSPFRQLRFKDDNGKEFPKWEKKKLGEVCEKKSSNISANKIEENFGEFIIYGASGVLKKVDFYEEENDYVSIIKDGAGVGRIVYCKGKSSVLGTMEIIKPKIELNTYFLYCLLENIDFTKYITGSTIPHIYFKDYKNEICEIPCLEEQTVIANFLSALDEKINQTENQIQQTQQWKKGLLQKMFV
jgi:type I restriction enzyme S subunit